MAEQLTELETVREELTNVRSNFKRFEEIDVENGTVLTDEQVTEWEGLKAREAELAAKEKTLAIVGEAKAKSKTQFKRSEVFGVPGVSVKHAATYDDVNNMLRAHLVNGHHKIHVRDSWKRSADMFDADWGGDLLHCDTAKVNGVLKQFKRAQSTDTATQGEELKSGSLFSGLISAEAFTSTILQYCTFINEPAEMADQPLKWHKVNDTQTYGDYKRQNDQLDNRDLVYGDSVTLGAKLCTTSFFPISIQYALRTDTLAYLNETAFARLRRTMVRDGSIGPGGDYPSGYVNGSTQVGSAVGAGGINPAKIRDLYYAPDKEYRNDPSCVFSAHDTTIKGLETTLIDANDEREWGTDLNEGPSDRLRAKDLVTNNFLDVEAASSTKKTIFFGRMKDQKIRICGGPQLLVDRSRFVDTLSVFIGAYTLMDTVWGGPSNGSLFHITTTVA